MGLGIICFTVTKITFSPIKMPNGEFLAMIANRRGSLFNFNFYPINLAKSIFTFQ